jgi:hypothetical protein
MHLRRNVAAAAATAAALLLRLQSPPPPTLVVVVVVVAITITIIIELLFGVNHEAVGHEDLLDIPFEGTQRRQLAL